MTRGTKWQNFRKFLFCLLESVFQIFYLLNCVLDVKRRSMKGFEPMGTIESFESLCQKMSMPPYKILKLTLTFFDFFRVGPPPNIYFRLYLSHVFCDSMIVHKGCLSDALSWHVTFSLILYCVALLLE